VILPLLLAVTLPAAAGPGPVVADVRARLAAGYSRDPIVFAGVEPDVLFIWPNGEGIGIDLAFGLLAGPEGGGLVRGIGPKYAVMRRIGSRPLFCKAGAGAALLLDQGGNAGARTRLEGGFAPFAGRRVAFPVEGVLTAEVYGSGGASLSLGLGVGVGWVPGERGSARNWQRKRLRRGSAVSGYRLTASGRRQFRSGTEPSILWGAILPRC